MGLEDAPYSPELDDVHEHFFDRDGEPMSLRQWAIKQEDDEYSHLAYDVVGEFAVSTVWVGISTNPMINLPFETAIFDRDITKDYPGKVLQNYRWSSEPQAMIQHRAVVKNIRDGWDPKEGEWPDGSE